MSLNLGASDVLLPSGTLKAGLSRHGRFYVRCAKDALKGNTGFHFRVKTASLALQVPVVYTGGPRVEYGGRSRCPLSLRVHGGDELHLGSSILNTLDVGLAASSRSVLFFYRDDAKAVA